MAKQSDEERRAKARERAKAWAKANPERAKKRVDDWRAKNADRRKAQQAEYRSKNPKMPSEKSRAASREYYRKRKAEDPEFVQRKRDYTKAYRKAHPDTTKAAIDKWLKDNPERAKAHRDAGNSNRRARSKAGGRLRGEDIRTVRARIKCEVCGRVHHKMHVDHVIPLSRGGTNHLSNLQLLCQPCNQSKSNKTMQEWLGSASYEVGPIE